MKTLAILIFTVMVGTRVFATELKQLTVPEKARTASFVYKAEMFLGCKQPFGMQQGVIRKKRLDFVQAWLREDIDGIGESEAGKTQKKLMTAFLKNIAGLSETEPKPKWKGKDVSEVATLISADLQRIAEAAGVALESDKKTQNK